MTSLSTSQTKTASQGAKELLYLSKKEYPPHLLYYTIENNIIPVQTDCCISPHSLSSLLSFNSSNWFDGQEVVVLAVDDDFILESPYGAVLSLRSLSERASYERSTSVTLLISDTDRGEPHCCSAITPL